MLNATNGSLYPFDYHVEKCGIDSFNNLERNLIHAVCSGHGENVENEDDDDDLVEEDLIETQFFNGNNEVVKFLIRSVLYVMKEKVFTHLGNAVISVFVSNVIRAKVI